MPARVVALDPATVTAGDLTPAVEWLRSGGIVAFPTDTLYGLAVDPESPIAVEALFDLKERDARQPPPLVAGSLAAVTRVCGALSDLSLRLASRFWPGPLSLVLDAPLDLVPSARASDGTVAIRVPAHPIARLLADAFGRPVTATSANISGRPPARSQADLRDIGEDARVLVIDGGSAPGGAPSTIVDARRSVLCLIRAGAIGWDRVLRSTEA
jgi:L-threonylcarbamoyladenylate synthase